MKGAEIVQLRGISGAARQVPCAEGTLRALERRGIILPVRDDAGRRLFAEADILAARAYLGRGPEQRAAGSRRLP